MATSVTKYPTDSPFTFGTTLETGIAVESYTQNDTTDIYEQKNEVGEIIEVVTFNPRSEFTITGETSATATAILGKVLTVANLIGVQVPSGGISIVKSVNHSSGRAKNQAITVSGTYYPMVTLTVAP